MVCVTVVGVDSSSPNPSERKDDGSCTGVRKTMTQTTATRQPPAIARSLRLCSSAPNSTLRKNPLSKKKRAMLTELFMGPAYQNRPRADSRRGFGPQQPPTAGVAAPHRRAKTRVGGLRGPGRWTHGAAG